MKLELVKGIQKLFKNIAKNTSFPILHDIIDAIVNPNTIPLPAWNA